MRFALFLLLFFASIHAYGGECKETVTIDSVEYRVGQPWCGHRLDSSLIADPQTLVQLPQDLTFEDSRIYVTRSTRDAFVAMAEAARKDSIKLIADSGFRSARFQRQIIKRRLAAGDSIEKILSMVAPPGYSQHETGRALDLVPSEAAFANTAAYKWLKAHAAEYGFFETYPKAVAHSHHREPWHWYYKGTE
jgi:D-alanyl-D-alanine carboxypeptidase